MTSTLRSVLFSLALMPAPAHAESADPRTTAGNRPPQVLALNVTPSAPNVGEPVRLRAFGEDPDGDSLRWSWFIDGERQPVEAPELLLAAPAGGEYLARVQVDDGRGGLTESELRFKVFQPTWCAEAAAFHDEATLTAFYTGAPSLTVERQALIDGYVQALQAYRAAGGTPVADLQPDDTAATAPAIREAQLRQRAAELGRGLTPAELFAIALEASSGRVGEALRVSQAVLRGNADGSVREHLAPLRDLRGYSRERAVRVLDAGTGEWQFVSAAETVGADQAGAWAALQESIAQAFADRHGQLPFRLLGPEAPAAPRSLLERDLAPAQQCALLSTYALALAPAVQSATGAVPDPDRVCLRYTGAAIGTALARELEPSVPAWSAIPATSPAGAPYGSYLVQSPLSIELIGVNGEQVGFDQISQRFTGTTPPALVDLGVAADGTRTSLITPLFALREIRLRGDGEGTARFGAADLDAGFSRIWTLPVTAGASFRYEPAYALTDTAGTVMPHAAELHHDRQWAFPQAPMLIIALASATGLLLGLIWIWRRGPFAPAPKLPDAGDSTDGTPRCIGCGATTRPGARFCRQCGRQLR